MFSGARLSPEHPRTLLANSVSSKIAIFRDCYLKWLRLQAESLSFDSLEPFLSPVDLSSCSEDDYDSDDSERDLRLVEVVFLRFAFRVVPGVFFTLHELHLYRAWCVRLAANYF